ncbi:MAG: efflux transporter outer membrane subunit [Lautropia sp.]
MLMVALRILSGCAAGQAPSAPSSSPPTVPAAFRESTDPVDSRWTDIAATDMPPSGAWWSAFGDPTLDALVERAGRTNHDIHVAAARLTQARAALQAARAAHAPQAALAGGASRQRGAAVDRTRGTGDRFDLGVGASYEIDLAGRLTRDDDAAQADVTTRAELLRQSSLAVQTEVARVYFALRALDAERSLVRETFRSYQASLKLQERRRDAGSIAELELERMRTEASSVRADAISLDRRRAELDHALAGLIGATPSAFTLGEAHWQPTLPAIPPGIPSRLLSRRPDVVAARSSVAAAQARAGAARTAWFPNLALTAFDGVASPDLGDLLRLSARVWGLGALLSLPLFDGGKREAAVGAADGELAAALASYHARILVSFREVEDNLSALRLLALQDSAQRSAIASASRATELSARRYRNGSGAQLDLLDAQRVELRLRRLSLQVTADRHEATVGLIKALGGSWDTPQHARARTVGRRVTGERSDWPRGGPGHPT